MKRMLLRSIAILPILGMSSALTGCDPDQISEAEPDSFRAADSLITRGQWSCIELYGLGLRSGTDASDWKGPASYAMSDGSCQPNIPADFDERLHNTLKVILGFDKSEERTLILNRGVYPTGESYQGSFRKSSSAARGIVSSLPIASSGVDDLEIWVAGSIPDAEFGECDF